MVDELVCLQAGGYEKNQEELTDEKPIKSEVLKYNRLVAQGKRKEAYDLYISSNVWKRRRLEVLERDHYRCRTCWKTEEVDGVKLQVHHAHYVENLFRDDIVDDNLFHITLCVECHDLHTDAERKAKYLERAKDLTVPHQSTQRVDVRVQQATVSKDLVMPYQGQPKPDIRKEPTVGKDFV